MIRKQFFIEEEQNARLKSTALATGKSEAELIREGIDQRLVKAKDEIELTDWRAGWRKVAGMWADYPEIDEIMDERRKARGRRRDQMMKLMARKK